MPSAPTLISITSRDAQAVLVWTAPSGDGGAAITNYEVYRDTIAGGETLLNTLNNLLTHSDADLTNGMTYYYKVNAVNSV